MHRDNAAQVAQQETKLPKPAVGRVQHSRQTADKKQVEKQKMRVRSPQRNNKVQESEPGLQKSSHRLTKKSPATPSSLKSTRRTDRAHTAQDITHQKRTFPSNQHPVVKSTCASAPARLPRAKAESERCKVASRPLNKQQNCHNVNAANAGTRTARGGSASRRQQPQLLQAPQQYGSITVKIKRTRLKPMDPESVKGLTVPCSQFLTPGINFKSCTSSRRKPMKQHLVIGIAQRVTQKPPEPVNSASSWKTQDSLSRPPTRKKPTPHPGPRSLLSGEPLRQTNGHCSVSSNTESMVQQMGTLLITEEWMLSSDCKHTQEAKANQYPESNRTFEELYSSAHKEQSQVGESYSLKVPSKAKEEIHEKTSDKKFSKKYLHQDIESSSQKRSSEVEEHDKVMVVSSERISREVEQQDNGERCITHRMSSQAEEQENLLLSFQTMAEEAQEQSDNGQDNSLRMSSQVAHGDNGESSSSQRRSIEAERPRDHSKSLLSVETFQTTYVNQHKSSPAERNMEKETLGNDQQYFTTQTTNPNRQSNTQTADAVSLKNTPMPHSNGGNTVRDTACDDSLTCTYDLLDKVELLRQSHDLQLIRQSHEAVATYGGLDNNLIYIPKLNLQFTPDNSIDMASFNNVCLDQAKLAEFQRGDRLYSHRGPAFSTTLLNKPGRSQRHLSSCTYADTGKKACACPAESTDDSQLYPNKEVYPLHRIVDLSLSFQGNFANEETPAGIPKLLFTEEEEDYED